MSDTVPSPQRSLLDLGVWITLATIGFAALLGFIAVLDADNVAAGFGIGIGVASIIFLAGATVACALACLRRGKAEVVSLGSIVTAGVATDMFVLAIWRQIDNEAYGKFAGIAFVWSLFALVTLGLTLAVGTPTSLARSLYLAAAVATIGAGLISTWLIATAGSGDVVGVGVPSENTGFDSVPYAAFGNDELLRALGASLVLLAAFWFGSLAASRLGLQEVEITR